MTFKGASSHALLSSVLPAEQRAAGSADGPRITRCSASYWIESLEQTWQSLVPGANPSALDLLAEMTDRMRCIAAWTTGIG
jgi:hypothetical protein